MASLLAVIFLALLAPVSLNAQNRTFSLQLDGKEIQLPVSPVFVDGEILVPACFVMELLSRPVIFSEDGSAVTLLDEFEQEWLARVGLRRILLSNTEQSTSLGTEIQYIDGYIMIPIRAVLRLGGSGYVTIQDEGAHTTLALRSNRLVERNHGWIATVDRQQITDRVYTILEFHLPATPIFEAMGFEVVWDDFSQQMFVDNGSISALIPVGSRTIYVTDSRSLETWEVSSSRVRIQFYEGDVLIPAIAFESITGWEYAGNSRERTFDYFSTDHILFEVTQETATNPYSNMRIGQLMELGYSLEEAIDIFEYQVLVVINEHRASRSLPLMQWSDTLAGASRAHSEDIARVIGSGIFDVPATHPGSTLHTGSDGSGPSERARRHGWTGIAGENMAIALTPRGAVFIWMRSTGHRSLVLNTSNDLYAGVGISTVTNHGFTNSRVITLKVGQDR